MKKPTAALKNRTPQAGIDALANYRKLSLAQRLDIKLHKVEKKLMRIASEVGRWDQPDLAAPVQSALESVITSREEAQRLPADFKPSPKAKSNGGMHPGSLVCFRAKHQADYEVLGLEADQKFRVTLVKGSKLKCSTEEGLCVYLPRGHVELVANEGA